MIRLLFLSANPRDRSPGPNSLKLFGEWSDIDARLKTSNTRSQFEIQQKCINSIDDLQLALLTFQPHIVHFSGLNNKKGPIIYKNNNGLVEPLAPYILSTLFKLLGRDIRCVLLVACYDEEQAKAIVDHVDCVIGIPNNISYDDAIQFTSIFYQALGFGKSVQLAYQLALIYFEGKNISKEMEPRLITRGGIVLSDLVLTSDTHFTPQEVIKKDLIDSLNSPIAKSSNNPLKSDIKLSTIRTASKDAFANIGYGILDIVSRIKKVRLSTKPAEDKDLIAIKTSIDELKQQFDNVKIGAASSPQLYTELVPIVKKLLSDSEGIRIYGTTNADSLSLLLISLYNRLEDLKIFKVIHDESRTMILDDDIKTAFSTILNKLDSAYQSFLTAK
jgi:hypothetical protein